MDFEVLEYDGYNIHLVNSNKKKSIYFTINMGVLFDKDKYYKQGLMMDLLTETNSKYKTKREMALHLEDIYGASIYSDAGREGKYYFMSLNCDSVNPKYIEDPLLLDNLIKSLFECIFKPNIIDGHFDKDLVNQRKEYFIEKTKRNNEYPGYLVSTKSERLINPSSPLGLDPFGTIEQINEINEYDLVDLYNEVIDTAKIDIIVGGDFDKDEIVKLINKYAKFKKRNNKYDGITLEHPVKKEVTKDKFVVENNQSIYVEHYNVVNASVYERLYVANIFEMILGGGLESKLSRKVRKDNSLCYSINATNRRIDGTFRIVVSLEKKNVKKAQQLIKETIKEMTNDITEEEINNAKNGLKNEIMAEYDSITGMMGQSLFQYVDNLDPKEIKLEKYNSVTIDEVKSFADKLVLNTEFLLEGSGNNEEN